MSFKTIFKIQDPNDNLIKQWKGLPPKLGIVSEELQLSEQPPLGTWSIIISSNDQKQTKTFEVAEYVLPTFSVDVSLPPYATFNKADIVATVKATYTYGKPVKGEATLTVKESSVWYQPTQQV